MLVPKDLFIDSTKSLLYLVPDLISCSQHQISVTNITLWHIMMLVTNRNVTNMQKNVTNKLFGHQDLKMVTFIKSPTSLSPIEAGFPHTSPCISTGIVSYGTECKWRVRAFCIRKAKSKLYGGSDVGFLIIVTILRCWWQKSMMVTFFCIIRQNVMFVTDVWCWWRGDQHSSPTSI